jgi:aspartyl-tRNA(Asn)/glutamyl-tRNA(Gln) amidotransferase subunit C
MSLSSEEVDKIAKLARLSFSPDQKQKLQTELSDILNYVDQVKTLAEKIDVKFDEDPDALNLMRDDVAEPVADPQKFLAQAPATESGYVKVKSVLE